MFHVRTKHIEIDVHFIYENLLAKELDFRYISTEEQIENVLTKPLLEVQFDQLQNNLRGSVRIG